MNLNAFVSKEPTSYSASITWRVSALCDCRSNRGRAGEQSISPVLNRRSSESVCIEGFTWDSCIMTYDGRVVETYWMTGSQEYDSPFVHAGMIH